MLEDKPSPGPIIVKVGGSLFTMPDLGPKLERWLAARSKERIVLVPGGGAAADAVRDLDRCHHLGEDTSHWLALRALSLNAAFLVALLRNPPARVVDGMDDCNPLWARGTIPVMDLHAFAVADEGQPGCLPHTWSVTSDSLAGRLARVCGAAQLVLLKSTTIPASMPWEEAGAHGLVDEHFSKIAAEIPLVHAVNFRALE